MNSDKSKNYQNDLLHAAAWCLVASGFVVFNCVRRLMELFQTPNAISARTPLPEQHLTATVGSGVPASVDSAVLTVTGVNAVSVACLVLGIVLSGVALIGAAVLASALCVRMLRGDVFDRVNTRILSTISIVLAFAALCEMGLRTMGLNGVFAAAGGEFNAQSQLFFEQLPLFGVAFAVGVLVIVFRRGTTLQRDTEGLV